MIGLKLEIKKDVIKARPDTLIETFSLAQLHEKENMCSDIA